MGSVPQLHPRTTFSVPEAGPFGSATNFPAVAA